jgi:endogenous inhibitor of DNA gyrase (YacG/DUF329 family)
MRHRWAGRTSSTPRPGASGVAARGSSSGAQRIGELIPGDAAHLSLEPTGQDSRRAILTIHESWLSRPGVDQLLQRPPTRCRTSGRWVSPTSRTYPFIDQRSSHADLFGWLSGSYHTSREPGPEDEPDGPDR